MATGMVGVLIILLGDSRSGAVFGRSIELAEGMREAAKFATARKRNEKSREWRKSNTGLPGSYQNQEN